MKHKILITIYLFAFGLAKAQHSHIITPQPPQPASMSPVNIGFPNPSPPTNGQPFGNDRIQRQNEMLIQQDRQRLQQQQEILAEIEREMNPKEVQYEFPDQSKVEGTEFYREAFAEITQMLEGKKPVSLKKAVFLTENAWFGNQQQYEWFCGDISSGTDIIKTAIQQAGYDTSNVTARKWMLQKYMADTVVLKDSKGNPSFYHLPYRYDFEDPFGKTDWSKMFVTKLLGSREGQCHSMPLLYLILAEELGIDARLTYSPGHSYIKVQNGKGEWFNYETTNGQYSTDSWVLSSGYVKAEAVKNGVYLKRMSKKEVIASCLADLAKGYALKYGFDKFVLDCLNTALKYHPNNIYALQLKSDYNSYLFHYVISQLGFPPPDKVHEYPKAYELLRIRDELYQRIDQLGYEPIPDQVYQTWLQSFETEKKKQPEKIIRP
jgi:hypothetical protein